VTVAAAIACGLVSFGCSRDRGRQSVPNGELVPGVDTGVATVDDSAPTADTATAIEDGAAAEVAADVVEIFDFGPVDDVAFGGDGPAIEPTPGTLPSCTADKTKLSTLELTPGPSVPKAFADAWIAEVAKRKNGLLLLEVRGLKGLATDVKFAVGMPNNATPASFATDVPPPAVLNVTVDAATRRLFGPRQDEDVMIELSPSSTLHIGSIGITATLDSKCETASGVKLTLVIPVSAGSTAFGGSTVGALLGPANDVIAPNDAWRIELLGNAAHVGGL
jgi:hypothetical protein